MNLNFGKLNLAGLSAGVAFAALLAGCAEVGGPGFGQQAGCKTVYVFRPGAGGGIGVVQPMSTCNGVPRDRLDARIALAAAQLAPEQETASADGQPADPAAAPVAVKPISAAAEATRPAFPPETPYAGPNEMLENADMAAFMQRVREDYAAGRNSGAWVYAIVDAVAAGDTPHAQDILDAAEDKPTAPDALTAAHLRPWVMAFAGRTEAAQRDMSQLRRLLPGATLLGHRALLAEGVGDTAGALAIYNEAPQTFEPPRPEDAGTPAYLARAVAFNGQRMLALREAALLRALDRGPEAVTLLEELALATPEDGYVKDRLEKAKSGKERPNVRTLAQAMAQALSDEADLIEERQAIMGMMVGRGGTIPFNHLIASLRQSSLLLDPDNGETRIQEVGHLYQHGYFEAVLRLAQIGDPRPVGAAASLASTAGLAALELGSPETLLAMTERALAIDSTPNSRLAAAGTLTSAGYHERAIRLIDQAMREGLDADRRPFAWMGKAQARMQSGDVAGAVSDAREAVKLKDDEDTKQFLASMLVKSTQRAEGLQIMREMLAESPDNPGQMNNFGYALVDGHTSREELDEGFKLLKEASRMTPDEPNLLDSVGWAYYQYGDFREARRYLELAVEAYQPFDHWELLDHLGDIKWRMGEQDAAREDWRASVAARPPSQDRARLEAKLRDGLTTPAPEKTDPPDVPRRPSRGGVSDI